MAWSVKFAIYVKKIAQRFDCVIAPERSDLACYDFYDIMIDSLLAGK